MFLVGEWCGQITVLKIAPDGLQDVDWNAARIKTGRLSETQKPGAWIMVAVPGQDMKML